MNNIDFRQHLINVLTDLGVEDYEQRVYSITPVQDKDKGYLGALDDIMRLRILPGTRKVTFDTFLKLFTIREGYYPCRIEITRIDTEIYMKVSLRMRKAENKDDGKYYPFCIKISEGD